MPAHPSKHEWRGKQQHRRECRRKAKGQGKYVVKPKYRNPADPNQTWAGRGKRPRWFADALTAGKKEKDLLIK